MSDFPSSTPFDLTGEFGGIILTDAGKRRLRLLVGGTERLLKVPREMRRRMIGNFRLGQTIRVRGVGQSDPATGKEKWVVSAVLPLGPVASSGSTALTLPSGPIRVCAKKNCWRQGGCELFAALEQGISARGLGEHVRVKAVNCLDRCKQGPNLDWGDHEFSRCRLDDVDALLNRSSAAYPPAVKLPVTVGS